MTPTLHSAGRHARRDKSGPPPVNTICLSLISHTNVGKTTLARTLLRRDVGQVLDAEHVTDIAEAHLMIEDPASGRLLLWDTPGFGSTASLLKRLKATESPIKSFLLQTWDRFRNRPLWCSQQAVRNVQVDADVVLYLIDASQRPQDSAFVTQEMEILQWIGKPVVVLLNQLGPPRAVLTEEMEEESWRQHLRRFPLVQHVLGLDAFARCWVQEHILLDLLTPLLPPEKRTAYTALKSAWVQKNLTIFEESMAVLGRQLAESACDRERAPRESLLQKIGVGRKSLNDEMDAARNLLSQRLAQRSLETSNHLIHLHELAGQRKDALEKVRDENFQVPQQVNESLWTAVGGILSGAAVGVAAELKAGGLLFGGGTVVGIFAGGAGAYLMAKGYNLTRAGKDQVRWTEEHFAAQTETALLFYLAVSHWGRGRGDWAESEHPGFWREKVRRIVAEHRSELDRIWKTAGGDEIKTESLTGEIIPLLRRLAGPLLEELYPKAAGFLQENTELSNTHSAPK